MARCALSLCVLTAALFAAGSASAGTGTLTGQVTYTRTTNFPDNGLFRVVLSSVPAPQGGGAQNFVVAETTFSAASFTYKFQNIPPGTYVVSAYRDVNGNGIIDTAEPYGSFTTTGGGSNPQTGNSATYVTVTTTTINPPGPYDITMADAGAGKFAKLTGDVTYAGVEAGTLFVQAETPNNYGCSDCGGTRVAFTSATWSVGQGTYNYSLLLPAATSYRLSAFLDLSNEGLDMDAQVPGGVFGGLTGGGPNYGTSVGGSETHTQNIVMVDPGTSTATNAVISGTIAYSGALGGNFRIIVMSTQANAAADLYYFATMTSTGAFTVNVASPPIAPGGCYGLFAYRDVNGNGRVEEKAEPATQLQGAICAGGDFAFSGSTAAVGTVTLADPTNTGSISGTVYITSGTPESGTLVVKAEEECNDCNQGEGMQVIPLVAGTTVYSYTLPLLKSSTGYFVEAFIETNGSRKFGQYQSTFNANGPSAIPYSIRSPEGAYGVRICSNGPCLLTAPVVVATNSAPTTGINFAVLLPPTQPPDGVTVSTDFVGRNSIKWTWNDALGENGFRLIDASSVSPSGDLSPHVTSYADSSPPLAPNTPYTRAVVAFNHVGMSTSAFKTVYTRPASPRTSDF
ncbi:MAG: DUF2141 domain-containing protein, partial [Elusimicrobiota bacterium]|nr:DUF2141 domain-containing protein [Elusimicrobiota bacterium]